MSAKSRFKYQQAQKHGFKPQIPDSSDDESFADLTNEIEQTQEDDSVVVSEKKRGIFTLLRSQFVSFFAVIFHYVRRIIASGFAKVRNFQRSYLASITTEGPKEENTTLFSQNRESSQEKNLPDEDPLLAQQIKATSRQLTELHQNLATTPLKEEEELFDEDDFDEAVRKARSKLAMAAALVFFCIGSFFAYQFVAARWSKENLVATTENNNDTTDPVLEEDDSIFSPQSVEQLVGQNPPYSLTPETSEKIQVPLQSDFDVEPVFASTTASSFDLFDGQDEPLEMTFDDSLQEPLVLESPTEDEFADDMDDLESTLASPIPSAISLGPSQQVPQTLQGEIQGVKITIPDSPVANLPLPQTSALAQRAAPAAPFAKQFQENNTVHEELEGFDDEPFAPMLATPNQRYQANVSPTINETAIQVPPGNTRRHRALPFGDSPTQSRTPIGTETSSPAKTLVVQNDSASQQTRQYTVQEDDNLFNIAQRELGDVTRWREIRRLNRESIGNNAGYLTPGTVISLPDFTPEDLSRPSRNQNTPKG